MEKKPLYIVGKDTQYDDDRLLFYTYVGVKAKHTPDLHYSCWGNTEAESKQRAERLGEILTAHL